MEEAFHKDHTRRFFFWGREVFLFVELLRGSEMSTTVIPFGRVKASIMVDASHTETHFVLRYLLEEIGEFVIKESF